MRFHVETKSVPATTARAGASRSIGTEAARFGFHFMQMCAVMCVSLVILGLVVAGAGAVLGFGDPRQTAPVLSGVVVTLTLAGSMLAWMRFMGMAWRPTLEMVGSTVLAGAVVLTGYCFGGVPADALIGGVCGLACVGMIAVMLPRFQMYASHAGHHGHSA